MITLYVQYLSSNYFALLSRGFVHWSHYVDADNVATMCGRI